MTKEKNIFFAKNLKTALFVRDISQDELAGIVLVEKSSVSRWIRTGRPPKGATLDMMLAWIGVTKDLFLNYDLTSHLLRMNDYPIDDLPSTVVNDGPDLTEEIARLAKHIGDMQERLKEIVAENERVLA